MKKHTIEWGVFFTAAIFFIVWLFVGLPLLNMLGEKSPVIAYVVFLLVIGILGAAVGIKANKSVEAFFVSIAIMLVTDISFPPIVLSFDKVPTPDELAIWGSDTALYTIFTGIGFGHQLSWIFTYFVVPMFGVFILLFFLSGKALRNKMLLILNGK